MMNYVGDSKRSESSASRRSIDGDTAEEGGDDRDESKRRSRNLSEKKRRDQFNVLINELCSMVSSTPRKMDKSTVLKATISFLKAHNELSVQSQVQELQEDWKPSFLSNEEFTYLMLEALDGFIMVISSSGKIIYVSESVTSLLGHLTTDLLNTSLYDFVPSEERSGLFNVLSVQTEEKSKNFSSIILNIRLGGLEIDEDVQKHQLVKLTGYVKSWISADCCDSDDFEMNDESLSEDFEATCLTKYIFVCTGRLLESDLLREMSVVVDSANTEFSSRHSLEWKFLFLDHRAPPIIGYLPFEVLGTSGYDYYHIEDLERIATCHETLMQKGEGTSCYYRFLTKGQQWIWLQTRYYITYHQWNSKPEFIVGTHRVVSYADVLKELRGAKSAKQAPKLSQQNSLKVSKFEAKNKSPTGSSRNSSKLRLSEHLALNSSSSKRSSSTKEIEPPPKFSNYIQNCHYKDSSPTMPISHFTIHPNTPFVQHSRVGQAVQPSQAPTPAAVALPLATFHLKQLGTQYAFTGTNTLQSTSIATTAGSMNQGLLITNSPNALQEQLLIKHAEIQRRILLQQEELRRVSEQLLINSQCGLVPNEQAPILLPQTSQAQLSHNIQTSMDDTSLHLQQNTGYPNFLQYQANVMGFSQIPQQEQSGHGDGPM